MFPQIPLSELNGDKGTQLTIHVFTMICSLINIVQLPVSQPNG